MAIAPTPLQTWDKTILQRPLLSVAAFGLFLRVPPSQQGDGTSTTTTVVGTATTVTTRAGLYVSEISR